MEKILITGASGFVGKRLSRYFLEKKIKVMGTGTSPAHPFTEEFPDFEWICADTTIKGNWQNRIEEADIIINLAGKSIFSYWTPKYKQAIYDSRILTTKNIVEALKTGKARHLLNASAVGVYGDAQEKKLTENSAAGNDFLARVCIDWEEEALKAKAKDVRVSIMRFGVVLGNGGALSKMVPAFKWFAGGPLGNGKQWFPWIHIKDIEHAAEFIIHNDNLDGAFNFTAPTPLRQKQFAGALGKVLKRPAFMPAPAFVIKMLMGELGKSLLQSQNAVPENLLSAGYSFLYDDADAALNNILKKINF